MTTLSMYCIKGLCTVKVSSVLAITADITICVNLFYCISLHEPNSLLPVFKTDTIIMDMKNKLPQNSTTPLHSDAVRKAELQ